MAGWSPSDFGRPEDVNVGCADKRAEGIVEGMMGAAVRMPVVRTRYERIPRFLRESMLILTAPIPLGHNALRQLKIVNATMRTSSRSRRCREPRSLRSGIGFAGE
jgi:hypothetical protein